MGQHLVLTVHLHDRFHGMAEGGSEWPPAPGRLFQALVAGAARGRTLPEEKRAALEWLESQPPPVIGAPLAPLGSRVVHFMPNNDADSLACPTDPRDLAKLRSAKKATHPRIPDPGPLLYAWRIEADPDGHAAQIAETANGVYQLGRGVDMAWAEGDVLSDEALSERLARFEGAVHTPGGGRDGVLACPAPGTLRSLVTRHVAPRLTVNGSGKKAKTYFTNAPKPLFVGVAYRPQVQRLLFDLRRSDAPERSAPGRPSEVVQLVERIRDAAVTRLEEAMPGQEAATTRCLVGKRPDGTGAGPTAHRVRIIPLLSIGHEHADRGVRRVLVEIPSGAPLRADDLAWAFTGLDVAEPDTREVRMTLIPAENWDMLRRHYLPKARCWQSVTPVAVPDGSGRRRIDPTRRRIEAKGGNERRSEEATAAMAVCAGLRHVGVRVRPVAVRVQREPFDARGQRAEAFERKPRFPKERLWHVEIAFGVPVEGPLLIGDGRFLGLGLMAPVPDAVPGVHAFAINDGLVGHPEASDIARALRRAVMARVQSLIGSGERLDPFFSGHGDDGRPVRRGDSSHLAFAFESNTRRLFILAPHVLERRAPTPTEIEHLRTLDLALAGFRELRAGGAGLLVIRSIDSGIADEALLFGRSIVWKSSTPYVVTRHVRGAAATAALTADVLAECRRIGLPAPLVEPSNVQGVPGSGLTANVSLIFDQSVAGPVLLGRTRYLGGGLFLPVKEPEHR